MPGGPGVALAQGEQERGHLLLGGAATQQQHLVLRERKFVPGPLVQAHEQVGLSLDQPGEVPALEATRPHRSKRLGRDRVALLRSETEEVARQGEAHDLAPSVGKQA